MERLLTLLVFYEAPMDFAYGVPAGTGAKFAAADARGSSQDAPRRHQAGAAAGGVRAGVRRAQLLRDRLSCRSDPPAIRLSLVTYNTSVFTHSMIVCIETTDIETIASFDDCETYVRTSVFIRSMIVSIGPLI
ncbi:hypothetical protein BAE44_0004230 [Dichanthelium oligosanthes]|uniref:Uncharacterized protein n=1 Tax=Dichanthelium oligosanthes TaxID=888268 RepID=A0A1E5WBJ1_9POAL|nr:hypothetical protein BAE44_0004230 [Dichanthelium oligosanthes]